MFNWGPVLEIVIVDTTDELASNFGKPTNANYLDFMCASSFLAYANNLQIVRVVHSDALNATATASAGGSGLLIQNLAIYQQANFSSSSNLWVAKCPGILGNNLGVAWADNATFNAVDSNGLPTWPYHGLFSTQPGTGHFHIVVYDFVGGITGLAGSVLETFPFCSANLNDLNFDGTSAYVSNVINNESQWLWIGKEALLTGGQAGVNLAGGVDGSAVVDGDREAGWALFADVENVDVDLIFAAGAGINTAQYMLQDIAAVRKDCVGFVSPLLTDVVYQTPTVSLTNSKTTRTTYGDTSYGFMDSNWKLMYDRYNDVNRWVPLNGDTAGLAAQATNTNDAWWSPAGYNRGNIKNCIKLAYAQSQSIRDALYQAGINPCVSFPNQGPILYGDKTMQTLPSAFDRIGVRRLFLVLEKAISQAAKYQLFEFNDDITRAKFVNMVQPFLDTIRGRRGLQKAVVVCDATNNTDEIVSSNQFVASIFVLPNYSINYITLSFVAENSGVQFDEDVVRA